MVIWFLSLTSLDSVGNKVTGKLNLVTRIAIFHSCSFFKQQRDQIYEGTQPSMRPVMSVLTNEKERNYLII